MSGARLAGFRATIEQLPEREIQEIKSKGVYSNGRDNLYPQRIERLVNASATTKAATDWYRKLIFGRGFGPELNPLVVDPRSGRKLSDFLRKVVLSFVKHNGVFIHVMWNANFQISRVRVLDYKQYRVGESDDTDYSGFIVRSDSWFKSKDKRSKLEKFHVFNPRENVIQAQVEAAGGWKKYRGQILFIHNQDEIIYPLAPIDAAYNDADTEAQSSIYSNRIVRNGDTGKNLIFVPSFLDEEWMGKSESTLANELSPDQFNDYKHVISEKEEFIEGIKKSLGAEGAGGAGIFEVNVEAGQKIEDVVKSENIKSSLDDQLFAYTDTKVEHNILKQYGPLPKLLVNSSDNSIFGNSGELIKQAKLLAQQNTTEEREWVEEKMTDIFGHFQDFPMPGEGLKIQPLIDEEDLNRTGDGGGDPED